MFFPQLTELDIVDISGKQADDINSLMEYIDQVTLGNADATPEDEDDDNGQSFLVVNAVDLFCQQTFLVSPPAQIVTTEKKYPEYSNSRLPNPIADILCPPPKV